MAALAFLFLLPATSQGQDIEVSRKEIKASREGYDVKLPKGEEEVDVGPGFEIARPKMSNLWRVYAQYGDCRDYLVFQGQPKGEGPESTFGLSPFNTLLATHWENPNTLVAYYHIDGLYSRAALKSEETNPDAVPLKLNDGIRARIQIAPNGDLKVEQTKFTFQGKWLIIGAVVEASAMGHEKLAARCKTLRTGSGIYCSSWTSSELEGEHPVLAFPGLAPKKAYVLLAVEPTRELADATLKRLKAAKVAAYLKKIK